MSLVHEPPVPPPDAAAGVVMSGTPQGVASVDVGRTMVAEIEGLARWRTSWCRSPPPEGLPPVRSA